MRDDEQPRFGEGGRLTRGDVVHNDLMKIFPEWSSTRISRWLGVNTRTVQRWLKAGRGEFVDETIPSDVASKIRATAEQIADQDLGGELDRWIEMQLDRNHVHPEVLAAWLAHRYKKLAGRDID